MARFVYRLQSLLNLKEQLEENLKNELARAMGKLESEKLKLKRIESQKEEYIELFNTSSEQGVAAGELRELSKFISVLRERANKQKENVNYAKNVVDKYRELLVKAAQEREMLEKLRESRYKEFLDQQLKNEQKTNDEIFGFKYINSMTGVSNGAKDE